MTRTEFSKRTKLLAFQRSGGKCEQCHARLSTGGIEYHHDKECTFGGTNKIDNCIVVCRNCHRGITRTRVKIIAKSNRQRAKHLGLRSRRQSFPTNKDGPFRKKLDGSVVRR